MKSHKHPYRRSKAAGLRKPNTTRKGRSRLSHYVVKAQPLVFLRWLLYLLYLLRCVREILHNFNFI
jgi:hypothetical protein